MRRTVDVRVGGHLRPVYDHARHRLGNHGQNQEEQRHGEQRARHTQGEVHDGRTGTTPVSAHGKTRALLAKCREGAVPAATVTRRWRQAGRTTVRRGCGDLAPRRRAAAA
jgi:hypothetical protein